jgi:uncharacterized protein involved in exopolysaccharide biosynthesis
VAKSIGSGGGEPVPTRRPAAGQFALRVADAIARRWWLYIVPLVLLVLLGALTVSRQSDEFRASGVVNVSGESLITDLTSVRGGAGYTYETVASKTSRDLNDLLQTDVFMRSVVEGAGLTSAVEAGTLTFDSLRASVWAAPDGDSLLNVTAATHNPELSQRLAAAAIDSFIQWTLDGDLAESRSAEEFLLAKLQTDQETLQAARDELTAYVNAHEGPALELRPLAEQVEIQSLTNAIEQAEARYQESLQQYDAARLASDQATSDVNQRFRIVDEPLVPAAAEPRLKEAALTMAVFIAMGGLLSAAFVAVGVITDRTLRFGRDAEARLGVDVVAVLPEVKVHLPTP